MALDFLRPGSEEEMTTAVQAGNGSLTELISDP
jgi:hypothetical protein